MLLITNEGHILIKEIILRDTGGNLTSPYIKKKTPKLGLFLADSVVGPVCTVH